MQTVTQDEAIAQLPQLIDAVQDGEEIVVLRNRIAVAKIVSFGAKDTQPSESNHLSYDEWLALLYQSPSIASDYPAAAGELLSREHIYDGGA